MQDVMCGQLMWGKWVFREIVPPERLVWVHSFSDEHGGLTRHPAAPDWPLEMLATVTFAEGGGSTTVTVVFSALNGTAEERATFDANHGSMQMGWTGTFETLEEYLRA